MDAPAPLVFAPSAPRHSPGARVGGVHLLVRVQAERRATGDARHVPLRARRGRAGDRSRPRRDHRGAQGRWPRLAPRLHRSPPRPRLTSELRRVLVALPVVLASCDCCKRPVCVGWASLAPASTRGHAGSSQVAGALAIPARSRRIGHFLRESGSKQAGAAVVSGVCVRAIRQGIRPVPVSPSRSSEPVVMAYRSDYCGARLRMGGGSTT